MTTIADAADIALARAQLPLRGPDLPLLVSLDILLEECNVTRAAARLHLSQPALSAQLARLRQLFDDPLLVPSGERRGYVPSPFAVNLHRRLKPALATLTCAIQPGVQAFRPERDARCFTIAATHAAAAMIVPALIGRMQQHGNAALKCVIVEPAFATLAAQMEQGAVDICLGPACMLPAGLATRELLTTPHVLAQRPGHPRGAGPVTLDAYCELGHVNVGRAGSLHGYIDEQLYRQGRSRQVALGVQDAGYVPALLKSTDLVCTLPAQLVASMDAGLVASPLDFALAPYVLCAAWHPRGDGDPGGRWLRGELAAISAGLGYCPPNCTA